MILERTLVKGAGSAPILEESLEALHEIGTGLPVEFFPKPEILLCEKSQGRGRTPSSAGLRLNHGGENTSLGVFRKNLLAGKTAS